MGNLKPIIMAAGEIIEDAGGNTIAVARRDFRSVWWEASDFTLSAPLTAERRVAISKALTDRREDVLKHGQHDVAWVV